MPLTIGRPSEWVAFEERNASFFGTWPRLQELIEAVANRSSSMDSPADRVIWTLGRGVVEEFMEILLNAGNGYGVAALKLLRGMYERVITTVYLAAHPEKVQDFLDYHHVHTRRAVNHVKNAGGDMSKYSADQLEEVERDYQLVKERFQERCSRCAATRDRGAWSELDLASMARDSGLHTLYPHFAFWPTMLLHTTVFSMANRLEEVPDGTVLFNPGAQRKEADSALYGAHVCLSLVLECHINHFGLALSVEEIRRVFQSAFPQRPEARFP